MKRPELAARDRRHAKHEAPSWQCAEGSAVPAAYGLRRLRLRRSAARGPWTCGPRGRPARGPATPAGPLLSPRRWPRVPAVALTQAVVIPRDAVDLAEGSSQFQGLRHAVFLVFCPAEICAPFVSRSLRKVRVVGHPQVYPIFACCSQLLLCPGPSVTGLAVTVWSVKPPYFPAGPCFRVASVAGVEQCA